MTEGVGLPLICLHQARIEGNPEQHPAGSAVVRAGTEEGVSCRDHVLGRFGGGEHGIGGGRPLGVPAVEGRCRRCGEQPRCTRRPPHLPLVRCPPPEAV